MVSTRNKKKQNKIPSGTKIDITKEEHPQTSKNTKRKLPMDNPSATIGSTIPVSPSPVDVNLCLIEDNPTLLDQQEGEVQQALVELQQPVVDVEDEATEEEADDDMTAEEIDAAVEEAAGEAATTVDGSGDGGKRLDGFERFKKSPAKKLKAATTDAGSTQPTVSLLKEGYADSTAQTRSEANEVEEEYDATTIKEIVPSTSASSSNRKKAAIPKGPAPPKGIAKPRVLDFKLYEVLGVAQEVRELFAGIGWNKFLEWPVEVYEEQVREMFDSMVVIADLVHGVGSIAFSFLGEKYDLHVNELNQVLGMVSIRDIHKKEYREARKVIPGSNAGFWEEIWSEIGNGAPFKGTCNKGHELKTNALRLYHRILAYNLYGKTDSDNALSNKERFLLWCMQTKTRVNFAAILGEQFKAVKTKPTQRYSCGHFLAAFAKGMEVYDLLKVKPKLPNDHLNLHALKKMRDVEQQGKRVFFADHVATTSKLPPSRNKDEGSASAVVTNNNVETRLANIEKILTEICDAQQAFFAHQGFRYPHESASS